MILNKYKKDLIESGEVYLHIKVKPNASKTEAREDRVGDFIVFNVKALADKGKANLELIKFLVKEFNVNKKNIKIISGVKNKVKLIKIINYGKRKK